MLADNKISSKGAIVIAGLYSQTMTLQELHLQNNEIDNDGGAAFVKEMKKRKLQKLEIDNNKLSGPVLQELLSFVPLSKLHIVKNKLTDA